MFFKLFAWQIAVLYIDANGNKKYIGMYDKSQRWCYDVLDVKGLTPFEYRDLILQEKAKMTA